MPHDAMLKRSLERKREKFGRCPVWERGGDTQREKGVGGVATDCRTNPHSSTLLELLQQGPSSQTSTVVNMAAAAGVPVFPGVRGHTSTPD